MRLSDFDFSGELSKKKYEKKLKKQQLELLKLGRKVIEKKIPLILMLEGWDAAGKGGVIKRVTAFIDPRFYKVYGIGVPTQEEKNHHHLWRFWTKLPESGRAAIFDRSWYGRVLVERVEGFAKKREWKRAYQEINNFEKSLTDNDTLIIKIFLNITKDEQLRRFQEREADKLRRWKLTPDDWENRKRWDEYAKAIDEMLKKTNTKHTPWHIVSSNDKKFARVTAMKIIITALKKRLKKK